MKTMMTRAAVLMIGIAGVGMGLSAAAAPAQAQWYGAPDKEACEQLRNWVLTQDSKQRHLESMDGEHMAPGAALPRGGCCSPGRARSRVQDLGSLKPTVPGSSSSR